MKILVLSAHYLPGFKGGGPIRSLANLVERLGGEFSFSIITSACDLESTMSYEGIVIDKWNKVGNASVYYMAPGHRTIRKLRYLLNSIPHDIIYINNFFSWFFGILPMLLCRSGLIAAKPIAIAPRGQFSLGALHLKMCKKVLYLFIAKSLGIYRGVHWQASSVFEEKDIRKQFGAGQIGIAPNLPRLGMPDHLEDRAAKIKGRLLVVFLSRISPMKNLDSALDMLKDLRGQVVFDIFGIIEDKSYWDQCKLHIKQLPANVSVSFKGLVAPDSVSAVFRKYHLLLLPTRGENFGHVILEAFSAGCPVLISNRTPWRNLKNEHVGWDIPLDDHAGFAKVLQDCVDMDSREFNEISFSARQYGERIAVAENAMKQNKVFFNSILIQT